MVDTTSTSSPAQITFGASHSQNTSDTSSRKEYEKESAGELVHDEGDDAFVSHQKYMFLVQSRLGQ